MQLQVIGTGSKGNSYLLENDHEALLIDCGVGYKSILQAVDFNISKIQGCIVTHEHMDHARSMGKLLYNGVVVYSSEGTLKAMDLDDHYRGRKCWSGINFRIGNFVIMPFDVEHDAAEPFGYLIDHPETGTILFLTDTYYSAYTFKGLNNIIIGINYDTDIIRRKLNDKQFLKKRIMNAHMSLETALALFKANDLTKVNNIVLTHLSDSNSNEEDFIAQVKDVTGKTVHVADDGMSINLNKTPF